MFQSTDLFLFASALLGGALNSVAGGGTFFTFSTLLFTGMPPVAANATSTMALWPGSVASVAAYRQEALLHKKRIPSMVAASLLGGLMGAIVLLETPEETFEFLIPYLLLAATILFASSPTITRYFRDRIAHRVTNKAVNAASGFLFQLMIGFYGGYFGAGIGILMLALLGLMGLQNIHEMNALKTILGSAINGIAVLTFIFAGAIVWPQAIIMLIGAILGGYWGAHYAKKVPQPIIRGFVILVGSALTLYFFLN